MQTIYDGTFQRLYKELRQLRDDANRLIKEVRVLRKQINHRLKQDLEQDQKDREDAEKSSPKQKSQENQGIERGGYPPL